MTYVHHHVPGTRVPNPAGGHYSWDDGGVVDVDPRTAADLVRLDGFTELPDDHPAVLALQGAGADVEGEPDPADITEEPPVLSPFTEAPSETEAAPAGAPRVEDEADGPGDDTETHAGDAKRPRKRGSKRAVAE